MQRVNNPNSQFEMYNNLKNGDLIETGEKPILADIEGYDSFFKACSSVVEAQKKSPHLSFANITAHLNKLVSQDLEISETTNHHIEVINARLGLLRYSDVKNKDLTRLELLKKTIEESLGTEPIKPVKLSTLFEKGVALCTESSILAQAYLQRQGIDSYLCKAKLFQDTPNGIISENHHFLVINDKGRMFVYDPLNTKETGHPRIMDTGMNKEEFIKRADSNETFILDFKPELEKKRSVFDIGDPHHLGYGIFCRKQNPSEK